MFPRRFRLRSTPQKDAGFDAFFYYYSFYITGLSDHLADPEEMRAYHKMALVNGDIFVIGGYNGNNNYHKNCRKYNLKKKTWSHVTPMNVERSYVSVAVIGRKIYAIGGYNGQFRLNTAEAYDLDTNQVRI